MSFVLWCARQFHEKFRLVSGYEGRVPVGTVAKWDWYLQQLDEDTVTTKQVDELYQEWRKAAALLSVSEEAPREYVATVPTTADELRANTAGEFVDLLAMLVARSGVSAHEIARRAPDEGPGKLGKSQVYSLLKRRVLPRKGEQVRSWAQACGMGPELVEQLLDVWARLVEARDEGQEPVPATPSPDDLLTVWIQAHEEMPRHDLSQMRQVASLAPTGWVARQRGRNSSTSETLSTQPKPPYWGMSGA